MYSQITGSIPVRTDVDLSAPAWSMASATAAQRLTRGRSTSNRVLLSLAHNMAQPNQITAAMIDVLTEFVHNDKVEPPRAGAGAAGRRPSDNAARMSRGGAGARALDGALARRRCRCRHLAAAADHRRPRRGASRCGPPGSRSPPRRCCPNTAGPGCATTGGDAHRELEIAYINLSSIGVGFVVPDEALGLLLAVLLDQRMRGENVLRTIFLYPLAVSFVVTGTVWSWLLNPGLGIQKLVHDLGWTDFRFDWLIDRDMAIYTIVIAGVWQAAGFAMALFLAGLRSVDADCKAAQIDGAGPWRTYRRVVLPTHLADLRRRARDPAAVRHQDVRPGARADRRRAGHRHHAAGARGL